MMVSPDCALWCCFNVFCVVAIGWLFVDKALDD
jgi:hypothetical protein